MRRSTARGHQLRTTALALAWPCTGSAQDLAPVEPGAPADATGGIAVSAALPATGTPEAGTPSASSPAVRGDLRIAVVSTPERLGLWVRVGPRWSGVCWAPCERTPAPGRWRLALSYHGGDPVPIDGDWVTLRTDGTLRLSYVERGDLRTLGVVLVGIAGAFVAVGAGLLVGRNEGGDRGLFVALASASFVLAAVFVLGGGGLALTRDSAWADFFPSALPARSPAQNW